MNINKIKDIVNSGLSDLEKEKAILQEMAKDENAITYVLQLLDFERDLKSQLITDSNLELSRAMVALKHDYIDNGDVLVEIKKHFAKWKGFVKCSFKGFD